jgi:hypothetical protein
MTLLPAAAQDITYVPEGAETPSYELPEQCAMPECDWDAFEAHHIVRRSYTQGVGPQNWISIRGKIMPNLVGLCLGHHSEVTNNNARIIFADGIFCWKFETGAFAPLHPVPLIADGPTSPPEGGHGHTAAGTSGAVSDEREEGREIAQGARGPRSSRSKEPDGGLAAHQGETDASSTSALPPSGPVAEEGETAAYGASAAGSSANTYPPARHYLTPEGRPGIEWPAPEGTCPTCKRKLPKPKAELETARPKVTWSIKVPKDAQEDGYELLRSLVTQCEEKLGQEGQPPYFTLMKVMYDWLTM